MSSDASTKSVTQQLEEESILLALQISAQLEDYCKKSLYPIYGMKYMRNQLSLLQDKYKLLILTQDYSEWSTPLKMAASRGDAKIISSLLTSIQSLTDRLKLLKIGKYFTHLHVATNAESVRVILYCLTADQQNEIMSVEWCGETALQRAESRGRTDIAEVLRTCECVLIMIKFNHNHKFDIYIIIWLLQINYFGLRQFTHGLKYGK